MPAIWRNPSSHWRQRTKAIEPVLGGMRGSGPPNGSARASERSQLGQGVSRGRYDRVTAQNRNAGQADKPAVRRDRNAGDAEALRRRVEEPELENAVMREVAEVVRKRPGRRPAAPVEQGEDASGRPSEADVFAQLDDMLARHRTGRPPTATTPGSSLTDTPGCVSGWPGRSPLPRAGTGTAGSRPCSEPATRCSS